MTMIGHAGFIFESPQTIVLADPWLSPEGAFDSAWFQLPRNHDLAPDVCRIMSDRSRERIVYISHEHQDHCDPVFLRTLPKAGIRVVIPQFRRRGFGTVIKQCGFEDVLELADSERLPLADGELRIFVDDSRLNRDSALLLTLRGFSFLDLNDCKLFDRLDEMVANVSRVDVFASQFTGATWHPTCYAYDEARYARISTQKMMSKFETVAKAIEAVSPLTYVPSAGPACFLDPDLLDLNFQPVNIFPRSEKLVAFLNTRLSEAHIPHIASLNPGDCFDPVTRNTTPRSVCAPINGDFSSYIDGYARSLAPFFSEEKSRRDLVLARHTKTRLVDALHRKLQVLTLAKRIQIPLFISTYDKDAVDIIKVDFRAGSVMTVTEIPADDRYEMSVPAWQIASVLDGRLTWEEFSLTFRMRLFRQPDVYQPILHAFLVLEAEDLGDYCRMIVDMEANRERINVDVGQRSYSILRYCPHQGGDMLDAWVASNGLLTCPRHRWQFDCEAGGRCTTNDATIEARLIAVVESPIVGPSGDDQPPAQRAT